MGENHFVVVDAGFDNLIRPAFYGAFHDMHVIRAGINDYHPDAATYDGTCLGLLVPPFFFFFSFLHPPLMAH